jgi:hypothetical protein
MMKKRAKAKVYALMVFISAAFLSAGLDSAVAAAETKRESVRDLLIRLNREYELLNDKLKSFDESIKTFPNTTLNLSVTKREPSIRLVSVEFTDNDRLMRGHTYTQVEDAALGAGGRHQIYMGEISEGVHRLKVMYSWADGGAAVKKGESTVTLSVKSAKNYVVELTLQRKGRDVDMRVYQSEYSLR